jgi:hypothetical protein
MGFGSFFKNIGKQIKLGINKAEQGIVTGFKKIEKPFAFAEHKVEGAVSTAYNDGKSVVQWGGDQYGKTLDAFRGLVGNLGSGSKDLLSGAGKGLGDIGTIGMVVAGTVAVGGVAWAISNYNSSKSKQNYRGYYGSTKQNSRTFNGKRREPEYYDSDEDCECGPKKSKKR